MKQKVAIVSRSEKAANALYQLIELFGFEDVLIVPSGRAVRDKLIHSDIGMLIINPPLLDESGINLAIQASKESVAGIIMTVKQDYATELREKLDRFGILVVEKPLSRQLFAQSVSLACASNQRLAELNTEKNQLQTKLEEIRYVNRAKCALIQYLRMTEPQAHRYIEKQAMDLRVTKVKVAQDILKTYEL